MNDADLEGFRPDRYFARSWALLTRDRGWIKPILAMIAATLVPIVGLLGVMGYAAEWARLTAWGVTSSPKQKNVRVGACIASGWRVFVVTVVWSIANSIILGLLALVPLFGPLLVFAWTIFSIALGIMIMVAALRATIYQRIVAGLRVPTIWQMVRSDVAGLVRIFGMQMAGAAIFWVVSALIMLLALGTLIPQIVYFADYVAEFDAIMSDSTRMAVFFEIVVTILGALGPWIVVGFVLSAAYSVVMMMLGYTAVALWMRQFNVPAWGREEDPLPGTAPTAQPAEPSPAPDPEPMGLVEPVETTPEEAVTPAEPEPGEAEKDGEDQLPQ